MSLIPIAFEEPTVEGLIFFLGSTPDCYCNVALASLSLAVAVGKLHIYCLVRKTLRDWLHGTPYSLKELWQPLSRAQSRRNLKAPCLAGRFRSTTY